MTSDQRCSFTDAVCSFQVRYGRRSRSARMTTGGRPPAAQRRGRGGSQGRGRARHTAIDVCVLTVVRAYSADFCCGSVEHGQCRCILGLCLGQRICPGNRAQPVMLLRSLSYLPRGFTQCTSAEATRSAMPPPVVACVEPTIPDASGSGRKLDEVR